MEQRKSHNILKRLKRGGHTLITPNQLEVASLSLPLSLLLEFNFPIRDFTQKLVYFVFKLLGVVLLFVRLGVVFCFIAWNQMAVAIFVVMVNIVDALFLFDDLHKTLLYNQLTSLRFVCNDMTRHKLREREPQQQQQRHQQHFIHEARCVLHIFLCFGISSYNFGYRSTMRYTLVTHTTCRRPFLSPLPQSTRLVQQKLVRIFLDISFLFSTKFDYK